MAMNKEHIKAVIIVILTIGLIIGVLSIIPKQQQPSKSSALSINTVLKKTNYTAGEEITGKIEINIPEFPAWYKLNALVDSQTKGSLDLVEIAKSSGLRYSVQGDKIIMTDKIIVGINTFGLTAPNDPGNHYLTIRVADAKEDTVQFTVQ
ncbi:MAG TPA: hypothetical protein VI894_02140 [Candidatus Nanoarchaeia archaeon]|nr:hypothetical protein [Candidatus Nanoarchaeia archaeon]